MSAQESITLYEKRGRRYYPVARYMADDAWPAGAHLVVCEPATRLVRFDVDPDHAALLAAAEPVRAEITRCVMRALAARPSRRPVTPAQAEAWKAFQAAMGDDIFCVEYASASEVADRVARLVIGCAAANQKTQETAK